MSSSSSLCRASVQRCSALVLKTTESVLIYKIHHTEKYTWKKKIPFSQSTLSNMTCTATAALGASAFISSCSTYPVSRDLLNCNVKYLVILNFVVLSLKSKKETCGGLFHPQVCKFKFFPTIRIKQKSFQHNRFYLQQTKLHPAGQESIHPKLHTCHLTST